MALFSSASSSLTCHIAPFPFALNVTATSHPSILPLVVVVFSKALFSALYYSVFIMYTIFLSTLISSLSLDNHLYTDGSPLFFFTHSTLTQAFLTFKRVDRFLQCCCQDFFEISRPRPRPLGSGL